MSRINGLAGRGKMVDFRYYSLSLELVLTAAVPKRKNF
jgi:hypothetical protein